MRTCEQLAAADWCPGNRDEGAGPSPTTTRVVSLSAIVINIIKTFTAAERAAGVRGRLESVRSSYGCGNMRAAQFITT